MSARIDVEGDHLVVTTSGWDRLWAARRPVRVPLSKVTDVRVVEREDIKGGSFRLWGTYWPGVVKAGRYLGRRGNEFWMLRDGRRAVVVETYGRWARLVVETADPHADAARVSAALRARTG